MPIKSERVIDYSVYLEGDTYLGTAKATLPEISYLADTIKGGGIAGEINAPSMGHTGAMTLTLNWRTVEPQAVQLLAPKIHQIDLRAAIQAFDPATGEYLDRALRITVRARPVSLSLGNLEPAAAMDSNNTFSVSYIKIVKDNDLEPLLEIDKYNYVHKVNGVDHLAHVRNTLGIK
ncbi:phage tail protein [Paenibacillus spiritus]|uniref:Phage tail protein n=1 Tax=Paenibacillus spiritus TaxID=2496557 RepID=A0A5J5G8F8_9BACL|nr:MULTISPECIES: phage major tail tube protein [Paenibacillus]KAA9003987.1 phage tail protein [Paenibacillus spiritus]